MHWSQYQELQKIVELGDLFVSYVDRGEGPPIVLLHGFPGWGYVWHRLLPALERSHRVLIPDLPGFGWSDRSDRFDRGLGRQAERLEEFLKALGIESAAVVGHELGGAAALLLAARAPGRVERLCLAAPACYDWWPSRLAAELARSRAAARAAPASLRSALRTALAEGFAEPDDELLDGLLAPYATEAGKLALVRAAGAMDPSQTAELAVRLPRLETPALVAWGTEDGFAPVAFGKRLVWDLPRAQLSLLPGAGHFCFIDRQADFAARLQAFLQGALPRPEEGAGLR